ncbi:hypothetical protein L0F63_005839 [Massospora cicadina]|nr:hypothetical protein L0F63_005839 [Massospora cicadina]
MQGSEDFGNKQIYSGTGFPEEFPLLAWASSANSQPELGFSSLTPGFNPSSERLYFSGTNIFNNSPLSHDFYGLGLNLIPSFQSSLPMPNCDSIPFVCVSSETPNGPHLGNTHQTFENVPIDAFGSNSVSNHTPTTSNDNSEDDILEKYLDWSKLTSDYSPLTKRFNPQDAIDEQKNPKVAIKRLTKPGLLTTDTLIQGINELKSKLPVDSFSGQGNSKNKRSQKVNKSSVLRRAAEYIKELELRTSFLEKQNEALKGIVLSLPGGAQKLEKLASVPTPPETTTDMSSDTFSPSSTQFLMVSFGCLGLFHFSDSDSYGYSSAEEFSLYSLVVLSVVLLFFFFCIYMIFSGIFLLFKVKPKPAGPQKAASGLILLTPSEEVSLFILSISNVKATFALVCSFLYYKFSASDQIGLKLSSEQIYQSTRAFVEHAQLPNALNYMLQLLKLQLDCSQASSSEIYTSLGLLLLAYFPRISLAARLAKICFEKSAIESSCGLLGEGSFFEWLLAEDLSTVCRPPLKNSLTAHLCNSFYLSKVESLAVEYLVNPKFTPSLRPLFSEVVSNPLVSEGSSCLSEILRLEICLAFLNANMRYGIKLLVSLVNFITKYPEAFSSEKFLAIKGLFGVALSRPGPYQNITAGVFFLDEFLNDHLPFNSLPVFNFLTSHIVFTHRLAVLASQSESITPVCPEGLIKAFTKLRFELRSLRSYAEKHRSHQAATSLPDSLVDLASFYAVASRKLSRFRSFI